MKQLCMHSLCIGVHCEFLLSWWANKLYTKMLFNQNEAKLDEWNVINHTKQNSLLPIV